MSSFLGGPIGSPVVREKVAGAREGEGEDQLGSKTLACSVTLNFTFICFRYKHFDILRNIQRGLKYTENKPVGLHYLGVTRTTMSSAVHTLTQVEGTY
jgi:hypothetical protein